MTTLGAVLGQFQASGIPCVLIGGLAIGAYAPSRATDDADLLAPREALDAPVWEVLRLQGFTIDIRRGEVDDPLVGVVRARRGRGRVVDIVVVGRWADAMLSRGKLLRVRGVTVTVADAADLCVLKLYAGSPVDLDDVRRLVAANPGLAERVTGGIGGAPECARDAWASLTVAGRSPASR